MFQSNPIEIYRTIQPGDWTGLFLKTTEILEIIFLIPNKQLLQAIYKMHFWAKSAVASQFPLIFKPFKMSTHFSCSVVK